MEQASEGMDKHPKKRERTLAEISVTVWLNEENAAFYQKNGFLYIKHNDKDERAFLCRQFPFDFLWEFISVMNEEQQEIGIIRRLDDFTGEGRALLEQELNRRYYAPVIEEIMQIKERYGFSYWHVKTKDGEVRFTLHDTYRSIIKAGEKRVIMLDVDGNRFQIPDVTALNRKSYKKIELYL
jgi:hypothetical protein